MTKKYYLFIGWISVMIITSMACATFNKINSAKRTADAVVTQVKGLATEIEDSGAMKTVQAFATQELPDLIKTGEALATQSPDLIETGMALVTEAAQNPSANVPPSDIPVLPQSELSNYYGTREMVTYTTKNSFQMVVEFYQKEMKNNGWKVISNGTLVTDNIAVLNFEKTDRIAQVLININPLDNKTVVLITTHPK